jgi:hypothetical protein
LSSIRAKARLTRLAGTASGDLRAAVKSRAESRGENG